MNYLFSTVFTLLLILSSQLPQAQAQSMSKPYKTVYVERVIQAPADRVWQAMVGDYGEISRFAPSIYASDYQSGSLKGVKGAERKCYFNEKQSQWSHERIARLDNDKREMKNVIVDAAKFPLDLDNSYAMYRVRDNGDGTSTASYEFNYRTSPGFMSGLVRGSFKKQLNETLIGLDHYLRTGEEVNGFSGNWDTIKKDYKKRGAYKGDFERG